MSGWKDEYGLKRWAACGNNALRAIDDLAAIGALESLLAAQNEPLALLAVECFDRMAGTDAALALARQAVCSPSLTVHEAAAQALRHKDVHSYVPVMLAAISGPIQSRVELFTAPNRRLIYRHVFFREG